MIYLDNSATTFPKPQNVVKAICESFSKYGANPGRSGHSFSTTTAIKIMEVREKLCKFVNAESASNVIFTSGCTEALNLAIWGTAKQNGHVICTTNDHNSVLRPIFELEKQGTIQVDVASASRKDKLTLEDILPLVKPNTYLICVNHISNVDGMESDILEIGKYCFEKNILFLVDSAQSLGHKQIDMAKQHIDLLAVAGHKGLYGPMGIGSLVVSSKIKLLPFKFGGTGTFSADVLQPTDIPEGMESGTLATPLIIGLGAGIDFVLKNQKAIIDKLDDLSTYINYELSLIQGVKVFTHPNNAFGVIAFNIRNEPSTKIAQILDEKFHIMVRSGLHCAPLKHKQLGTFKQGVVRASISCFTTFAEVERFIKAIKNLAENK